MACAEGTLDKIRRTGTMVIAYPDNRFPFAEAADNGSAAGYSIDICRKIADAVRRELKLPQMQLRFLQVNSSGRFDAIARDQADIECGSTTNNAARRERFAFTIPHFYTSTRMMVRADAGIHSWLDMRDKRVVTVRQSSVLPYVKARDAAGALNLRWTEVGRDLDAIAMVTEGRVDAYVDDDVLLSSHRSAVERPELLAVVGEALAVEPYAMMVRKNDAAFKAVVDREMVRIISDGEIYSLYDKWFMRPVGAHRQALGLTMSYLLRDSFRFPSDKAAE
ncbi:amino acid ABC transporter substrate-binding protein [Herbaspirillum sp. LeCh32-8]|uniref:amino acid ABC transporter substrate-binding protein n=1 Tax=Herbaspirillum sp. LeCh32-8 TaxID=2821356 RepID=UPI001AE4A46F|nr:amino acid ABC transporter substrate-binding protein [Herbaspirillum sp. LeCh32-8]MBP0600463.1 amino acid ABC transporter substrate-binding protein [Herbaspirillum sp. LeCh32-8]